MILQGVALHKIHFKVMFTVGYFLGHSFDRRPFKLIPFQKKKTFQGSFCRRLQHASLSIEDFQRATLKRNVLKVFFINRPLNGLFSLKSFPKVFNWRSCFCRRPLKNLLSIESSSFHSRETTLPDVSFL